MNWIQLKKWIDKLPKELQNEEVKVYVTGEDDYFPVCDKGISAIIGQDTEMPFISIDPIDKYSE